jgi:cystine transport system substrate-binding protein
MSKRFDVVANQVTKNPEREGKYALSAPYTVSEGVIITKADNSSIKQLSDLKGLTTAQSSTSNWAGEAKKAGAKVEAVEGFTQAVALVKQGRVDATVNDNLAALEYFKTTNDTEVKVAGQTGDTSEQVFALQPDDTALRDEINTQLESLRADGTLADISQKYFGQDVSKGTADVQADDTAATKSTWQLIKDSAGPMALATIKATIPLTLISFVIGLVIALVVALMRLSSVPVLAQLARFYVSLIRGTPLLVQLYLIFFGLPSLGLTFNSFTAAIIAFSLNVGGYAAEIIRAAILSVPKGQSEAALTLGMGYATTLRRVILPQALRTAVPPLSNTLISLVKDTSLASVVLVTELLRVAQVAAAPTFQFFALYGVAAIYYWVICLVLSFGQGRLETRLDRYVAR